MANVRTLRMRIRAVKNIQQITRAMKMVATVRLRKAQTQLLEARPYAAKLAEVIKDIAAHAGDATHPLLTAHPQAKPAWLVLTSDKGLCGSFNSRILQSVLKRWATFPQEGRPDVLAVGRKAVNFFRRAGITPAMEWAGFWQDLNWRHANEIGQEIESAYASGRWSGLTLIYNRFKSALSQELFEEEILPVALAPSTAGEPGAAKYAHGEYAFEPNAAEIFAYLLPRYVKNSLWHAFLESKAAELAAKMQAMGSAAENCADLIGDLTLFMNRLRQSLITREISELVGGAEGVQAAS